MLHDEMELADSAAGGGGGCCCAARAFPPQANHHDMIGGLPTEVQRIMLRFRPIAPRPAPAPSPATGSGGSSPINPDDEGLARPCVEKNRKKRSRAAAGAAESRPTRPTRTRRGPKPKQKGMPSTVDAATAATTSIITTSAASSEEEVAFVGPRTGAAVPSLPLAPDAPVKKEYSPPQFPTTADLLQVTAGWWERPAAPQTAPTSGPVAVSRIIVPTPQRPVCSVITVVASTAGEWDDDQQQESVGWLAACGEWEAKRLLQTDARPSVVSDPSGKVVFANAAYRRVVGAVEDEEENASTADERGGAGGLVTGGGMRTVLVAPVAVLENSKDQVEPFSSCRVKIRWCGTGTRGQPEKGSVTAPCDVCRLAGGSLAWRIDIGAALSLGPMG